MATPEESEPSLDWESLSAKAQTAEKFTGDYAQHLLLQAKMDSLPENDDLELVVLDEACGFGTVSAHLMALLSERSKDKLELLMTDVAAPMVAFCEQRIQREGWRGTKTARADAMDTRLPDAYFTHVLLGFGPFMFHDWRSAIKEIHRILRPGGTLAMSSWGEGGWLPDTRAALAAHPSLPPAPEASELLSAWSPGSRWHDWKWIENILPELGFGDLEVQAVARTSVLQGMEEFKQTIPVTLGAMMDKCWSTEDVTKHGETAKAVLINYMEEKYGRGDIEWDWVANLTTAKKMSQAAMD